LGAPLPEFKEPYPVYRGFMVPLWEKGAPVAVRRVTDDDRREFLETLSKVRELLERLVKHWEAIGVKEEDLLERVADAIAIFLKIPLLTEVTPVAPTPLKAFAYMLLLPEEYGKIAVEDPYEFGKSLIDLFGSEEFSHVKEYLSPLFDPDTSQLVFNAWVKFPADTRPGYNTSSLVAHALLTSALVWVQEYNREASTGRLALMRLAALLHDLGKALDPEHHYEASEQLARWLLGGLLPDGIVDEVARIVREHHKAGGVLAEADRLAAASDRLDFAVQVTIGEELKKMESLLKLSKDSWDFWREAYRKVAGLRDAGVISEDPVRELTQRFLERLAGEVRARLSQEQGEGMADTYLVLVDVDFVQSFVFRSQEIKVVAVASYLIDLVVHAHFLYYLRTHGIKVPPEAVLFSGGGMLLLVLPKRMIEEVPRQTDAPEGIREFRGLAREYAEKFGVPLHVASAPFSTSYPYVSGLLFRAMSFEKNNVAFGTGNLKGIEGSRGLCRLCYSAPAVTTVDTPEGKVDACEVCAKLYKLGSESHFGAKWESRIAVGGAEFSPSQSFGISWEKVSGDIMRIIAGHTLDEIEKAKIGKVRWRDYAVVKFDGNMMGSFMHEAVSFSDAVERSFRIDVAMKTAYRKALEALYLGVKEAVNEKEAGKAVSQVFLGTIYMGGDDGMILSPSWAAPVLAHFIAEEFCRQLGLKRGLSVAVVAGPVKMNLWSLIDSASELLKVAKGVIRSRGNASLGALVFDIYESGSPSGSSAVERISLLSRRVRSSKAAGPTVCGESTIDSIQSYLIDLGDGAVPEAWRTVFRLVFAPKGVNGRWSDSISFEVHKRSFGVAFLASRPSDSEPSKNAEPERLRKLRAAALRAWGEVSGSPCWREILAVYLQRQAARSDSELGDAYKSLLELVRATFLGAPPGERAIPLADLLILIKLAGGGAW